MSSLVQYIVVRADLASSLGWPVGSVLVQACHASVAALQRHADTPEVKAYLADIPNMSKVSKEVRHARPARPRPPLPLPCRRWRCLSLRQQPAPSSQPDPPCRPPRSRTPMA